MKKRGCFLLFSILLVVLISGCTTTSQNTGEPTSPTTTRADNLGSSAEKQVLDLCHQILKAEKNKDEAKLMSLIPEDSPDYEYMLETSEKRQKLDYQIKFFGCKLNYVNGDTARVEATYDYELNEKPAVMSVDWTFKKRGGQWVYWHGSR